MKGYTEFKIKGYNQERFFNNLSKKVKIYALNRDGGISTFKVSFRDRKKVEKEITSNYYEILSVKHGGFDYQIYRLLTSYGLVLGIVFGFVFFLVQSNFIMQIEVWGNEKISNQEVIDCVKENMQSNWKRNVDTKYLEQKIYSEFEDLSFISVAIVGQTLVVNIKEEIRPSEMEGNYKPIIADSDGIITNIELIQGTLAVEVGDIIQEGQVLVFPYIINLQGERMDVEPRAKIQADLWLIGSESHSSSYYETIRTGRKVVNNEVFFVNLKLYSKNAENPFNEYEIEKNSKKITKGNFLPFTLVETTYYETQTNLIEKQFSEVSDEIISTARSKALQKKEKYDIIKKEKQIIKEIGNNTIVNYIITVSRELGEG